MQNQSIPGSLRSPWSNGLEGVQVPGSWGKKMGSNDKHQKPKKVLKNEHQDVADTDLHLLYEKAWQKEWKFILVKQLFSLHITISIYLYNNQIWIGLLFCCGGVDTWSEWRQ